MISDIFMKFVEELETRVISLSDFNDYKNAYYQELRNQLATIF